MLRLTKDPCDVKLSAEPTCIVALQYLLNSFSVNYGLLQESTFRTWDSLQIVCLRIAVLFILASIWFSTVKLSKTESSDWWKYFARPLGLALITLWNSLVHLVQQKYSFVTHNKNNKARCKKSFLVVKMTKSMYSSSAPDLGGLKGSGPPTMFTFLAICTTCACHLVIFISEESLFIKAIELSVVQTPVFHL